MSLFTKKYALNITLLCLLTIASGCARYTPKPLAPSIGREQEKNAVIAAAHVLSYNDCRRTFSRNIEKKDYRAIQLSITNNKDETYVLHGNTIDFIIEPISYVAKDMHLNVAKRVLTWEVPGILLIPLLWPFIYIGIVDGCKSSWANHKLDSDFNDRCIDRNSIVYIKPHTTIHKIMFIRQENFYKKLSFQLESFDDHEQNIDFKLSL